MVTAGHLLIAFSLSLLLLPISSLAFTDHGDAAAMAAFAKALSSPLPARWDASGSSVDPCGAHWAGVSCSSGRVTSIDLKGLSLRGSLPPEISSLSSLRALSLQRNSLSGPLPPLSGLGSLRELFLGGNAFSSVPATFFSGLTNLATVSLDDNPFAPWVLPSDLSQCANIYFFSAMNASLVGQLPDVFDSLVALRVLRLSYNYLVGSLPPSLGSSAISIQELYLNNQLQNATMAIAGGKISGSLGVLASMTELSVAWLHVNSFTGPVPDLSKCTALVDLQLRDNQLTGVLPPSLASLPSLRNLTLSNNLLQGPTPNLGKDVNVVATPGNSFCDPQPGPCDERVTALLGVASGFGYPASFAQAWKGNNPCNAWVSVSCDAMGNITTLNFGGRNLSGNISDNIAKFGALKVLKLQKNSLIGVIPAALTSLPQLRLVDVSYNNLSGDVPAFRPDVAVIIDGNPLLRSGNGSGEAQAPDGSGSVPSGGGPSFSSGGLSRGSGRSSSTGCIALIILAVLAVVALVAGTLLLRRLRKCLRVPGEVEITQKPSNGPDVVPDIAVLKAVGPFANDYSSKNSSGCGNLYVDNIPSMFVPIQDLRRATGNFSEENILGRGGFGVVYRGMLPDGKVIAVKRMECSELGKKGMGEFKAEIEVLRKVRHRHLVALLGYCEQGNEKLLVYEYMPQGTLAQHLFHHRELQYPPLSWKQRLMIALDVARGLEYLHSLAQTTFIHRDLKPSNVLLDDCTRAKVSDFGLVKLAPDGKYSVETRLAGTFGYLAPEYATTGRVTTKVDVFAFGVVLMELITGKKALDESLPDDSSHLVTWFCRGLISKDSITKIVDPELNLDDKEARGVVTVAELAGHCTSRDAHQRPDMGHAVSILVPLVDQWRPAPPEEEDDMTSNNEAIFERLKRRMLDQGTSGYNFDSQLDMENTQGSLPTKPDMFPVGR